MSSLALAADRCTGLGNWVGPDVDYSYHGRYEGYHASYADGHTGWVADPEGWLWIKNGGSNRYYHMNHAFRDFFDKGYAPKLED